MLLSLATALFLAFLDDVEAGEKKGTRDPRELGRVAILPFLDITGERQEDKAEYRDTALDEVEERFLKHEIAFVPKEEMNAALKALQLVPTDEEDRTKPRLKELAGHLKVRYLVTGVIHESDSDVRRRGTLGSASKVGQAKVQFRVFDASEGRYVEERELTATSTARAKAFSGVFSRANKLRTKAVRDATKKAMELFIAPYPKVHDSIPGRG